MCELTTAIPMYTNDCTFSTPDQYLSKFPDDTALVMLMTEEMEPDLYYESVKRWVQRGEHNAPHNESNQNTGRRLWHS